MKVKQHFPSSFDGFDTFEGEVNTQEELLALPFIAKWNKAPTFWRFSVERNYFDNQHHLLLAEMRKGDEWWVVARLQGDIEALKELPEPDFKAR